MPEFNCPGCGQKLRVILGGPVPSDGRWGSMVALADSNSRRMGDIAPTPEFSEAYRDTPTGMQSKESHVTVPLQRTFITGGLGGLAIGLLIAVPMTPHNHFGDDIKILGISLSTSMAVAWFVFLSISDKTLWIREKIINRDLDNDGIVGKPDHVEFTIKREDRDSEGESWQLGRLPCPGGDLARLREFCQDITDGNATFSEKGTRDGSKSGAAGYGYTPTQWSDLRAKFLDEGWVYWKDPNNHNQGVEFTRAGWRVIQAIAR